MLQGQHRAVWPSGQTKQGTRSLLANGQLENQTSTQGVFCVADYRCSLKPVLSRSNGASVARAAAYIEREKVEDERTGETYDFSRHQDKALWTGIYAPSGAPEWAHDLQQLCNEIERAEKRKDSQLARPLELSLAHELTREQNRWMMQDFIKENFTRHGYATIAAIHEPPHGGDERNIHAHLLVSLRTIDENGFSKTKQAEQDNYLNKSAILEGYRESWEKHLKHHLKRHGFEREAQEVSCKSLEAQGIKREPQQHLGPTASDMERRGKQTERGEINSEIEERNRQLEQLQTAEKELSQAIAEAQRQLDKETKEQQAELERRARAQELRERKAKAAEAIKGAWTDSQYDPIGFMIGLNERGLYVAQGEKGRYAAVENNGFVHRLPDKDMQEAIDALRRENSGLIIPTIDQHFTDAKRERAEQRAERNRVFEEQRQTRAFENSVDLNQTQADIRLCFALTASGQSFAAALEDKGLILARTTATDVQGELAVVNQWGQVYALTERTTGFDRANIAARCASAPRAALLHVNDAVAVMRDAQEERDRNRAFENSVDLNQTQADIRLCFGLTASGQSFAAALEDKGLILAKATARDVEIAKAVAGLRAHEKDAPEWKANAPFQKGELVVVNQWGQVYALTERTTGHSRDDIAARCAAVDPAALLSVGCI